MCNTVIVCLAIIYKNEKSCSPEILTVCSYNLSLRTCVGVLGRSRRRCWFCLSLLGEAPQSRGAHEPNCTRRKERRRRDQGQRSSSPFLPALWSLSSAPRGVGGWERGEKEGWGLLSWIRCLTGGGGSLAQKRKRRRKRGGDMQDSLPGLPDSPPTPRSWWACGAGAEECWGVPGQCETLLPGKNKREDFYFPAADADSELHQSFTGPVSFSADALRYVSRPKKKKRKLKFHLTLIQTELCLYLWQRVCNMTILNREQLERVHNPPLHRGFLSATKEAMDWAHPPQSSRSLHLGVKTCQRPSCELLLVSGTDTPDQATKPSSFLCSLSSLFSLGTSQEVPSSWAPTRALTRSSESSRDPLLNFSCWELQTAAPANKRTSYHSDLRSCVATVSSFAKAC